MNCYFELEDAPGYLDAFPVLLDRKIVGAGEFSVVYEGTKPDTVLKLTCDTAYVDFITEHAGTPGLPKYIKRRGSMKTPAHGKIHLLEIPRLNLLTDEGMMMERDVLMRAVEYRVLLSERFNGIIPCQECHASALIELSLCKIFSSGVRSALAAIAAFLRKTPHDVLIDLGNPDNYMTDGRSLIITDPLLMVN